ncbi:MAG: DNA double-strand break repair nuclease NurA [Aquificae bacterium]|nr:DNA double-strand break repair nuclease NurA [Aquificota bacterium]
MRPELLEKTYKLKKELELIKLHLDSEISEDDVIKHWIDYFPREINCKACASDGSFNRKVYLGFYLYSVAGYGLCFDNNVMVSESFVGDIGISLIKNQEFAESYFRLLMFLVEMKSLLKVSAKEKPDVILLDGTLSGRFILPPPKTKWFVDKDFGGELAKLSGELIPYIEKYLFDYDITSQSTKLKELLFSKLIEKFGQETASKRDVFEAALAKLAYFEYFLLLHHLFYKLDWNPIIMGIAKTSKGTELFNSSIPDIMVFYKFIQNPGFSKERYVDMESKSKTKEWEFSEVFEKKETKKAVELKDVQIKYFYSKYSSYSVISLIEIYENPNRETIRQQYINDILFSLSAGGYPFILKKADADVRIKNKDMELIESILGLTLEKRGREVVE